MSEVSSLPPAHLPASLRQRDRAWSQPGKGLLVCRDGSKWPQVCLSPPIYVLCARDIWTMFAGPLSPPASLYSIEPRLFFPRESRKYAFLPSQSQAINQATWRGEDKGKEDAELWALVLKGMERGLTESKRTFFQMPGSIDSILNSSFSKEMKEKRKEGKWKRWGAKKKMKRRNHTYKASFLGFFFGEHSSFEVTQARLLALLSQNRLPHFCECSNPLYAME